MIAKLVRDSLMTHLSAAGTGLNDRVAALAAAYAQNAYAIDWSSTSTNFLFGRVSPTAIEQSSVLTFPLLTIDTVRSQDMRRIKFSTFSGPVMATIDVHHSWPDESVIADFASLVDMTEDAIIDCLNDQNSQAWPGGVLWNGRVTSQRSPIITGSLGWIQSVQLLCPFEVTV
jgi:hypothetical protein